MMLESRLIDQLRHDAVETLRLWRQEMDYCHAVNWQPTKQAQILVLCRIAEHAFHLVEHAIVSDYIQVDSEGLEAMKQLVTSVKQVAD